MTKKIEPDRTWCPDIEMTDNDWKTISEASGMFLDENDKKRIYDIIQQHYIEYCFHEHGMRANQLNDNISIITKTAEALFSALAKYDIQDLSGNFDLSEDWEFEQLLGNLVKSGKIEHELIAVISRIATESENFHSGYKFGYQFISEFRAHLYALIKTCEACKAPEDVSSIGARGSAYLTKMILDLKLVFKEKTGETDMTQQFVNFILNVSDIIKRQSHADFGPQLTPHVMRLTPGSIRQRVRDGRKGAATFGGQD